MPLVVTPGVGIGPLRFGMSKDQILETLDTHECQEFRRTPDAPYEEVAVDSKGFHFMFDLEGALIQITAFAPNEPELGGVRLLGERLESAREVLRQQGIALERVDAGLWSESKGVLLVEIDGYIDSVELHGRS